MISHRHLAILELIPTGPSSITVKQLQHRLFEAGMQLTTRMLQRDLQALHQQSSFGLEKDTRTKPYAWFINPIWRSKASGMTSQQAQHYLLLEQLLPATVPTSIKTEVRNKAEQALKRLQGSKPDWLMVEPTDTLKVNIDSQVVSQIEHAITHERRVCAEICRTIYEDPHWLVFNDLSFYELKQESGVLMASFMVGSLHDKCYQIPVYRIRNIRLLQQQRREPSKAQIRSLRLANNQGKPVVEITLVIKAPNQSALNLGFIEFGELQDNQVLNDEYNLLTYKVAETRQLIEYLFKTADHLEVIKPDSLRQQIINKLNKAHINYQL